MTSQTSSTTHLSSFLHSSTPVFRYVCIHYSISMGLTILQSNRSGRVSTTTDLWSVDQTKASFMGVTAHWIESDSSSTAWKLCSEVITFKGISGRHTGANLGQYFVSVCEHAGIIGRDSSQVCINPLSCGTDCLMLTTLQLFCITADNTSNNDSTCDNIKNALC